jgi:hypothetical protein
MNLDCYQSQEGATNNPTRSARRIAGGDSVSTLQLSESRGAIFGGQRGLAN